MLAGLMPRTSACRAQRVVGAIAAAILAAVIRVRKIPQVDAVGAMTEHDQKLQSLAAKIQNLSDVEPSAAELHSSRSIVFVPHGVRHGDAGAESHSLHPDIDSGIRPLVRTSASSVRTGSGLSQQSGRS